MKYIFVWLLFCFQAMHGGNIDAVVAIPEGKEAYPVVVLLQKENRVRGAKPYGQRVFEYWVERGVAVAAFSVPEGDVGRELNAMIDEVKHALPVTAMGGVWASGLNDLVRQRDDFCCTVVTDDQARFFEVFAEKGEWMFSQLNGYLPWPPPPPL